MTSFSYIRALFVQSIESIKRGLPFCKRVIISDAINFTRIDWDQIIRDSLFSSVALEKILFVVKEGKHEFDLDYDFREVSYKGINLYQVSKYNLCVDLEVFPGEITAEYDTQRRVIKKWYAKSAECIDFFQQVISEKKPHLFLVSQGHCFDSAVIRGLSCLHGFEVVSFENTFNKNKIVWDDVSGITVNKNLAKNYYWKYRDFTESTLAEGYVQQYLDNIKQMKSEEHTTPIKTFNPLEKKTVLFLGQVFSDSSVLFGINQFCSPVEVIERLVDYCIDCGFHLIIKLHPKEVVGNDILNRPYDHLTWRRILQVDGLMEKITVNGFVLDKCEYDTYALMDKADVCVTINSQAGLEALIKGREVIACGQGYYTGLGVTFDAMNPAGLVFALDQVLKEGATMLDSDVINKLFYIVSEKYFVDRSVRSVSKLLKKLLALQN